MKKMIEIDVPDGMEIDTVHEVFSSRSSCDYTVHFKKKGPEYLEVREFIARTQSGRMHVDSITRGYHCTPEIAERLTSFVRWIDKDWRKVEI